MIYTYQFEHIAPYISLRKNEEKLGQSLIFPKLNNFTGEYVILGISESYGVEANMGKTGAEHAWKAFLSYFLNIQHNKFIQPNDILIQGEIDLIELKKENDPHTIVETIDKLVSEEIHKIKLLNKTPIFIGGGHNNAYPIIKGVSLGLNKPISVLNIDAHADLRKTGERHSGNPFSYALKDNYLDKYYVHGLHEGYNNKYILNQLEENKQLQFNSYESILKNQESINASTSYAPSATNTAGTQRLADGSSIMGAVRGRDATYVWTDTAIFTMRFVGVPFVFAFTQAGTNCGLLGMNAAIEVDGAAYWMSDNGFFRYAGRLESLKCLVEDYVYDDFDTTKGQQVAAGINNLFTEVIWYYPTEGSSYNDRYVVFNYGEKTQLPTGVWYTATNTNAIRTTWIDSIVYPKPYATQFNSSETGTVPSIVGETGLGQTVYFQQETGTDQINPDGSTTTLTSFIQSYNFSLQKDQTEVFLAMRRFIPNFKLLTVKNTVTIKLKDYPSDTLANSEFSPFSVYPTTQKIDTRASGRYASLRIENDGAGENWRFGTFQVDLQPDRRR